MIRLSILGTISFFLAGCGSSKSPQLMGRAVLPAASFAPGPTSGFHLGLNSINGQQPPFINKQPVQGFSAVSRINDSTYWVMCDNGFGSMENSSDFNLRVYTIKPHFRTKKGGGGTISVGEYFELRDPDRKIPFTIANQFSESRVLTGADFDIESMQKAPGGTFWFGDEFGPFLLNTDATGKVLRAPIPLPDFDNPGMYIRSPQNPLTEEGSAVRIMNAFRNHGRLHGGTRMPVFSPYHVQLDDNNPQVDHFARGPESKIPAGSGLQPAESGIFNVTSMKTAGYAVVPWTVNDKPRMLELMKLGVNGIISDRPDLLWQAVNEWNADTTGMGATANAATGGRGGAADTDAGSPGGAGAVTRGWLDADGLLDVTKFDAQGHRGSRDLRPENTLPAMEAALDNLMTTLEADFGLTKDSIPILKHDPEIDPAKCRSPNSPLKTPVLIKNYTAAEIQARFLCDGLVRDTAFQKSSPLLSPVSSIYLKAKALPLYVMPTVSQLFEFVDAYVAYYKDGLGKNHPLAFKRWKNASRVHYNLETKTNPRAAYADRTLSPQAFAEQITRLLKKAKLTDRADVQSFDFRSLKYIQEKHPEIRTVFLFGDFPVYADSTLAGSGDGTNLQNENGSNSPWMAGAVWPYRATRLTNSFRQNRSGGFEGMALSSDGTRLYPLLEKPLQGADSTTLYMYEFDLASASFTQGKRFQYPLHTAGVAIGDFVMYSPKHGIIIERDSFQGAAAKHKMLYRITLPDSGNRITKDTLVNLMRIHDADKISSPIVKGDIGTGGTFAMPFETIEGVFVLDEKTIGVLNDNNFPFSVGRHVGKEAVAKDVYKAVQKAVDKAADDNEMILIRLNRPLSLIDKKN